MNRHIEPGIYTRHELSNEDYHADREYLSCTGLKAMLESPAHFYARYIADAPKPAEKAAFTIGSALHAAVLEPDAFSQHYVREPQLDKRTKAGKARAIEFTEESAGKIVLTAADCDNVIAMRDQVLANPLASQIVRDSFTEQSFFFMDGDEIGEKCRADVFKPAAIADVKTVQSALPRDFFRDAANYRYFMQGAFYLDVVKQVTGDMPAVFAFIAVEKTPPHVINVFTMRPDDEATSYGRMQYMSALDDYKRARDSNKWHELMPMNMPEWAKRELNQGDGYVY